MKILTCLIITIHQLGLVTLERMTTTPVSVGTMAQTRLPDIGIASTVVDPDKSPIGILLEWLGVQSLNGPLQQCKISSILVQKVE